MKILLIGYLPVSSVIDSIWSKNNFKANRLFIPPFDSGIRIPVAPPGASELPERSQVVVVGPIAYESPDQPHNNHHPFDQVQGNLIFLLKI